MWQPDMATIAHLANFYGPRSGGLRTTVNALALEYQRIGHSTHIIVPSDRDHTSTSGSVTRHEILSPRIPGSGGYRLIWRLRRVRELLQHIKPDSIELSDRTTLIAITDWARKRDVPTTLVAHERVDGVIRAFARPLNDVELADRINWRAANRVDHLVCTTSFAGQEFDRLGIAYTRIPLGVDLAAFHPRRWSGAWRDQFDAQMILVLCSRLSKEKKPEFALDALEALHDLGADAHLVIAGTGPLEHALKRRIAGLPATMLGFITNRDELARILASADVLLAPGPIETFGLAALEALASGTPVMSNQSSAVPEVCGSLGAKALPLDPKAWAEGITELTTRVGISQLARERASEFTWRRTAAQMLALQGLTSRIDEFA